MSDHPLLRRLPSSSGASNDDLLSCFLDYVTEKKLELYPAQEEAVLELFEDKNVILNTPTGSGKSLVATALHFRSLAMGRRSVYTSPIKALVNEKFLALCRDFGPDNVGMATGDATVNRNAPIMCCTAEILANYALRDGAQAPFREVIMDEFHYYADHERGVAWQVPLLTMSESRFLLMSATMGATEFFRDELTRLTRAETTIVSSRERPVPLEFSYVETPVDVTLQELVEAKKTPVYLVHFTQNEAAQAAQDLMSLNFCTPAEKASIKDFMMGVKFTSPYGKEVKRYLAHGVGIHHAGLLPKYRMLVEQLAQRGLLKVICGTDTLGVGVNVPIRTVLLTRLSKYGGQKVSTLSARDFHQISGRAGRRGFDDIGYVVAQAPEHVIENLKMDAKAAGDAKKLRKMVKKKPPEGFVGWNEDTFKKLQSASPEPLTSRFQVSHGMLLQVLSRDGDGCRAMQRLIADSHEPPKAKKQHRKRAWQLFRALVERKIIEMLPKAERAEGRKLRLNVELQDDFSLNHTLALYVIDTLAIIDPASPTYAADMMTLCESIMENPDTILRRQLSKVKDDAMAEMKAEGIPYEERMARLEELEYPKPCRDFIYSTFNEFQAEHPWVGQDHIRPKSIAREMFENFRSFADYIKDYELDRAEGVLLRHLSGVHKILTQTVPDKFKTESVQEMEAWLAGVLRGTDSSLLDEWERLRDPNWKPSEDEPASREPADITRNKREFIALVRTEIFRFLRPLAMGNYKLAASQFSQLRSIWSEESLIATLDPYYDEHERISIDNEARNGRHTYVESSEDKRTWRVCQVLVDPEGLNDWQMEFSVDLEQAREAGKPTLALLGIGPVVVT
ncbi:RAD3-like DEAD/DEAH box helicase [Roseimicrobium gellanilyticum]|uniref:RAD3-like DEAD/DEAH box helicase n=1 Tax=Roseimicrobium gellanilyticum TaxID=748857 RepID=A0A366H961_9BACT|nr:DEAD/DEAH box helicase [Roseimicrobium gellanilyticum]RBP37625.1 RAD3-like DEAD/DEAH box helicase [Roseimicrobium gellanilyticum]